MSRRLARMGRRSTIDCIGGRIIRRCKSGVDVKEGGGYRLLGDTKESRCTCS